MRKLVLGLTVVSAMMLVAATPANATRAIVFKNGDVACTTDPGDVPGFGVIQLPKATSVFRGDGGGQLNCHGWLPGGAALVRTFHGTVPCGVPGVTGRIVVTKNGRINASCHYPAGTFF